MPRTSRTIKAVALGVSGLVAGGVLYSALAPGSSAKISLSSDSMMHHGSGGVSARHWSFARWTIKGPHVQSAAGINNRGEIAGYLGSGAQGAPQQGLPAGSLGQRLAYVNENIPGAGQTQVTGLNDLGVTVGFFSTQNKASMMNNNFGFYAVHGRFHRVDFPTNVPASRRSTSCSGSMTATSPSGSTPTTRATTAATCTTSGPGSSAGCWRPASPAPEGPEPDRRGDQQQR